MSEEQKRLAELKKHEDQLQKDIDQNAEEMQLLNAIIDSKRKYSEHRQAEWTYAVIARQAYENKIKGVE